MHRRCSYLEIGTSIRATYSNHHYFLFYFVNSVRPTESAIF